jgi:predicted nucleotide-binding protein
MNSQLPAVFIGSSTEGLDVAREIELQLQRDAVTTIWKDGVFGPTSGFLESLMNVLEQFDFAVMVLSPDDLIESRNQSSSSPRDNVIFELGLFMGRLGRSRVFIVYEQERNSSFLPIWPVS